MAIEHNKGDTGAMNRKGIVTNASGAILLGYAAIAGADGELATKFSNTGGITNTRHNLTQNVPGLNAGAMDAYRNPYGRVCVYCHTPHGASGVVEAPLWNRKASNATYTTYDALGTGSLTAAISDPGVNSLSCLSCHDGTVAIDAILNMPGSGRYSEDPDNAFLNSWGSPTTFSHAPLGDDPNRLGRECESCHQPLESGGDFGATDFTVFVIGSDLRDDHPIGIALPTTRIGIDFHNPTGTTSKLRFYDDGNGGGAGNGRADTDEIRFYDTGEGPEVECASCHDPHGVSPTGSGGLINEKFLRVSNEGSQLCLTCHDL